MRASHRVVDNGCTVGFIIDGNFYSSSTVRQYIDIVDNVKLLKDGTLRVNKKLPELDYSNINKIEYNRLNNESPFVRDIQDKLVEWKKERAHSNVLQLEGPRQVGKTTELKKFAYSNYRYVIYVNMANDTYGFKEIAKRGINSLSMSAYCERAGLVRFNNSRKTILIIDEIQVSAEVYNSIRDMRGNLKCDVVVTGSYLGQTLNRSYFKPAGTVELLTMHQLSFTEFCRVIKIDKIFSEISPFGDSKPDEYSRINKAYEVYREIGGYPNVVKEYVVSKDKGKCLNIVAGILELVERESRSYFKDDRDKLIFSNVYVASMVEMCKEKRGSGKSMIEGIVEQLTDNNNSKLLVSRKEVSNAITWLVYCGILGTCDLYNEGNTSDKQIARRVYFTDCGVANYIAYKLNLNSSVKEGILTETFAYNELRKICDREFSERIVNESVPCFSIFNGYELAFVLTDTNDKVYGIEVKTTAGEPKSLKKFLEHKKIDIAVLAKDTHGGKKDGYLTIPIFALCKFPYTH